MSSNLSNSTDVNDEGCTTRDTARTPPLPIICAPEASDSSVFSFVKKGKDRPLHQLNLCAGVEPSGKLGKTDFSGNARTQEDGVVLDLNEDEPEWIRIGDPMPRVSVEQEPPLVENVEDPELSRKHREEGRAEYDVSKYRATSNDFNRKIIPDTADVAAGDVADIQRGTSDSCDRPKVVSNLIGLDILESFPVTCTSTRVSAGSLPEKELDEMYMPYPPSRFDESPGSSSPCAPKLPRPTEEYKSALEELIQATDKASRFFDELQTLAGDAMFTTSQSSSEVLAAASTYQEVMPAALQKVRRLAEQAAAAAYTTVAEVETRTLVGRPDYEVASSETLDIDGVGLGRTLDDGEHCIP